MPRFLYSIFFVLLLGSNAFANKYELEFQNQVEAVQDAGQEHIHRGFERIVCLSLNPTNRWVNNACVTSEMDGETTCMMDAGW